MDAAVYNIYFRCLCREKKSREALYLLKSMMEAGFMPNNVTYNTILSGFCSENYINEAFELLDQFKWDANGPDVVSYKTILSTACRRGKYAIFQRILHLYGLCVH